MIGLITNKGPKTAAIPRHLTTLSVSWLNNQFKAVAIHRGKIQQSWEYQGIADGPDKFEELVREAVRETGYQGGSLSLVLAHPRLVQQMTDVPPVKGPAAQKVIERQVAQQKFFSGEAGYASQPLAENKGNPRVLIHLFPKVLLNQFTIAARRNHLSLTSVLPASAALQMQLSLLGLQKGDVVMLAAETGGSTTVIAADGDGKLLAARSLNGNWNDDPSKLAVDLNRTLLFVSQQFNVTVNRGLVLFGEGAAAKAELIQRQIQFPVTVSPLPYEPLYWAVESLKVRPETAPNFQSPELQRAPQRRVFAKIVAAGAFLLLAACIGLTAYSFQQARREQAIIASFKKQVDQIQTRMTQLHERNAEMQRKQQAIQLVIGDRPAPKPAWLLAYLGQVVPSDLVVTNFSVRREADYYRVSIGGTRQLAEKAGASVPIATSIERLEAQLAGSPFNMRILEVDEDGKIAQNQPGAGKPGGGRIALGEWLNKLPKSVTDRIGPGGVKKDEIASFRIEGVMR